jgi:hypothetical protein
MAAVELFNILIDLRIHFPATDEKS